MSNPKESWKDVLRKVGHVPARNSYTWR